MSIVEFLEARIAEDESIGYDWRHNRLRRLRKVEVHGGGSGYLALVSPERVLAEGQAKRAIIAQAERWAEYVDGTRESDHPHLRYDAVLVSILGPLATVYADHPDYREEWKP